MRGADWREVDITGGFWREKQELNEKVTLDAVYDRFSETGRVGALACKPGSEITPHPFWDSDVAKWIEAASYVISKGGTEELSEKVEQMIDDILANQWSDGYINSYYTVVAPEKRFTVRMDHELYCCGHLIEAAVAYYLATGRERLLKAVCRYADLVDKVFRIEKSAAFSTPRHEEIELALFKLWRCTGNEKYKALAEYFINARGENENDFAGASERARAKVQDIPLREFDSAVGHCVCATYRLAGMADMALAESDSGLYARCRRIFDDVVNGKMYITGGIGSTYHGEAFTLPFDLPPDGAYTETCASVGMIIFCARMLDIELDSAYADVIETELYNGLLSGLSLSGDSFFYENPLEINLSDRKRITCTDEFEHWQPVQRKKIFECSCCPPNICRTLASLGGLIYSRHGSEVAVNQYAASKLHSEDVVLETVTDYPRSGTVRIIQKGVSKLKLRIPGWCERFTLNCTYRMENGYAVIASPAFETVLELEIKPRAAWADARVRAASGRAAICRGPVVYCAESIDNGGAQPHMLRLKVPLEAEVSQGDSFSGMADITAAGKRLLPGKKLYSAIPPEEEDAAIRFIPYHAFANRGESDMAVWIYTENSR